MTRQRNVWPRDQVAHLFANKSQDSARDPQGSFYFTGRALFSYGSHFIIACHVDLKDGRAILWNDATYSSTTSKHQWIARRALPSYVTRYGVDGLRDDDIRGRDWLLKLAQRCAKDAAQEYANAAACVRASAKRDGFASCGARYIVTARALAETVAAGVGDADGATAQHKREARALLKTLDSVPGYSVYMPSADGSRERAEIRKAANVAQREACTAAALALNREGMRQKIAQEADEANARADNARACLVPEEWRGNAPDYLQAERHALQADNAAMRARSLAKQYKLRAPKLPDMRALLADIAPHVHAQKRDSLEHHARRKLREIERAYHSRERAGYASAYSIARSADELIRMVADAPADVRDAVPAWVTERAAAIHRRMTRADKIEDLARDVPRVASEENSGDSYRDAGHARDAVRCYRSALSTLEKLLRDLPRWHPAWSKHSGNADSVSPLIGGRMGAELAAQRLPQKIATWSAQFAEEDAAKLAAWRVGESATFPRCYGNDSPRLRVSRDGKAIESSWGAIVPASVAPILWRLVQRARNTGEPIDFMPYDEKRPRVGSFRLDGVASDGGIKVGCHDIAWSELEHIAQRLGYITQGATA